jgi:hypothetical protein
MFFDYVSFNVLTRVKFFGATSFGQRATFPIHLKTYQG